MNKFWQVVPDSGYIMHAVRGHFADGRTRQRYGVWSHLTYGPTICGRIIGRDSVGMPTLRLSYEKVLTDLSEMSWEEVGKYWLSREPLPFAPVKQVDGLDVYAVDRPVCGACIRASQSAEREEA